MAMPRLEKAAGGRALPPMAISTGYGALAPIGTLMSQVKVSGSPGPVTVTTSVPLPGPPGVAAWRPPKPGPPAAGSAGAVAAGAVVGGAGVNVAVTCLGISTTGLGPIS